MYGNMIGYQKHFIILRENPYGKNGQHYFHKAHFMIVFMHELYDMVAKCQKNEIEWDLGEKENKSWFKMDVNFALPLIDVVEFRFKCEKM